MISRYASCMILRSGLKTKIMVEVDFGSTYIKKYLKQLAIT